MRTLNTQDTGTLSAPYGYAVHTRAFVSTYINPAPLNVETGTVRAFLFEELVPSIVADTTSTVLMTETDPEATDIRSTDVVGQTGNARTTLNNYPGTLQQGYISGSPGIDAATFTGAAMTFEAVFRLDRAATVNTVTLFGYGSALTAGGASADNTLFSLGVNSAGRLVYKSMSGSGVITTQTQTTGATISVGTWYHVAARRNGTTVDLFLNGTNVANFTGVTAPTGGTNARYRVGDFNNASLFEDSAWMSVDCFRVNNTAKSDGAILTAYQSVFPTTAAVWADLTDWQGIDWLTNVSIDSQIDQPSDSCTITLLRDSGVYSMSPLKSYAGAPGNDPATLQVGHEFYVETATMPLGCAPQSTDWRLMFRGDIDTVDSSQEPMTFTGRDLGGRLADRMIENEKTYGSTGGTALETVIQQILDDNGTGVVLYQPGASPGWALKPFIQKREPVFTAVRNLAAQIGYDVRYLFDSGSGTFRLTLYLPDRSKTTPDWTFTDARLRDVSSLSIDRSQVRNNIEVVFSDSSTLDTKGQPTRTTAKAIDATSVTKYGRRWMQIAESSTSNINSLTEAQALADAALADLKEPLADQEVTIDYFFPVILGDLFRFSAGALYAANQDLAVTSITHELNRDEARTKLHVRGKPLGGHADWLARDSRPGLAPVVPVTGPQAVTGLSATAILNGASITWTPAVFGAVEDEFEVHVSAFSGFTPDGTTIKVISRTTRADVTGLTAGTTYYCKVVPRDRLGNRGTAAGELSFVAGSLTTAGGISGGAISGTTGTFTGNLTVDTDVLKVDTAANRVGVNKAVPVQALDVVGNVAATGSVSSASLATTGAITSGQDTYNRAYSTAGQTIPNTTITAINFNNGSGWTSDGAGGTYYSIPSSGRYTVTTFLDMQGIGAGNPDTRLLILTYDSGMTLLSTVTLMWLYDASSAGHAMLNGATTRDFTAGMRIKIALQKFSSGSGSMVVDGDARNWVEVVKERG